MSFHEPSSRSLIATLPPRDEIEITFVIAASRVIHPFKPVDAPRPTFVNAPVIRRRPPGRTGAAGVEGRLPMAPDADERQYTTA